MWPIFRRIVARPQTWAPSPWLWRAVYQPAPPHIFELPNRVKTWFTSVGSLADSPAPLLRLSPVAGYNAEILDVEAQYFGYDVEKLPYEPRQRPRSPTSRAGLLRR